MPWRMGLAAGRVHGNPQSCGFDDGKVALVERSPPSVAGIGCIWARGAARARLAERIGVSWKTVGTGGRKPVFVPFATLRFVRRLFDRSVGKLCWLRPRADGQSACKEGEPQCDPKNPARCHACAGRPASLHAAAGFSPESWLPVWPSSGPVALRHMPKCAKIPNKFIPLKGRYGIRHRFAKG